MRVVGLVRRSLVRGRETPWPCFARAALTGARVVSVPDPLATHGGDVGSVADVPGEGVAILELFERHGQELPELPQLAATLAATSSARTDGSAGNHSTPRFARRFLRRLK